MNYKLIACANCGIYKEEFFMDKWNGVESAQQHQNGQFYCSPCAFKLFI